MKRRRSQDQNYVLRSACFCFLVALFLSLFQGPYPASGSAWAQSGNPRGTSSSSPLRPARTFSRGKQLRPTPATPSPSGGRGAITPRRSTAKPKPTAPGGKAVVPTTAEEPKSSKRSKGLVGGMVSFLVDNAVWIVAGLVFLVLLAVVYFWMMGSSSREEHPKEDEHRVKVRIPNLEEEEDEGPRRVLPGSGDAIAKAADVEREYALVVKEEDLKMPPLPEDADVPQGMVDSTAIQKLMRNKNYEEAYQQYVGCIEMDGKSELSPDMERQLGEYFIRAGDLEKAARILEHHVATHPPEGIESETYFNLGYIHFRGKTLNKSRRYFRLFVKHHKDTAHIERAKKILARIDQAQA